jgi:hypothetical protein
MPNTLLTIDMITREALRILENNLTFTKQCNRQFDESFGISGAKIGDTLRIRKPARYTVRSGAALAVQDHIETSTSLVLNQQKGVDLNWTSKEMTLSLDDFGRRVLAPSIAAVANQVDRDGLALFADVPNAVGTPGTTPATLLIYLQAGEKLDNEAAPRDGQRAMVINPAAQVGIVDALKGLFHSASEVEKQYEEGQMGLAAGFKWSMDQNIVAHTVGPLGGTPLVNGAAQTGSTLVTDGWTAAAAARLNRGDIFTIANVLAVNPQHRQSTGQLRQFVVTANVSSDGAGNASIPIYPALTLTGAYQTVNALPADNAALTILGAATTVTPQNIAFHSDAFTLGCADLVLPPVVEKSRVSSPKLGLSVRMVRVYDVNTDNIVCRFDILYGWKAIYPELACRVVG